YGHFIRVFLIGSIMMSFAQASDEKLITHSSKAAFDIEKHRQRLHKAANLTLPLEEELKLLEQMSKFELGRFLLENRGLNGYWTAYWLIHGPREKLEHQLENWLINKAPAFMASRERLNFFAVQTQKRITSGVKF